MIPSSRPKLSDLYTLSQSKLLESHTLHRAHTYIAHIWQYPPPPPWMGNRPPRKKKIANPLGYARGGHGCKSKLRRLSSEQKLQ